MLAGTLSLKRVPYSVGLPPTWSRRTPRPQVTGNQNTIYLKDNNAGVWRAVAPLPSARHAHTCTAFEGKLWVIGGWGSGKAAVSSVECYDPASDTWSKAPSLTHARYYHTTAVYEGKLVVIGGQRDAGCVLYLFIY